jgi:diadenosine tetraphosphatase ApaH/serine/threonine PP2A family protein phosphatase
VGSSRYSRVWLSPVRMQGVIQDLTFLTFAARRAGCGAPRLSSDSPERDRLRDKHEVYDRRVGASAFWPRESKDIGSAVLPN